MSLNLGKSKDNSVDKVSVPLKWFGGHAEGGQWVPRVCWLPVRACAQRESGLLRLFVCPVFLACLGPNLGVLGFFKVSFSLR